MSVRKFDDLGFNARLDKFYGEKADYITMDSRLKAALKETMIEHEVMTEKDELNAVYLLPEGVLVRINELQLYFIPDDEE